MHMHIRLRILTCKFCYVITVRLQSRTFSWTLWTSYQNTFNQVRGHVEADAEAGSRGRVGAVLRPRVFYHEKLRSR